MQKCAWQCQNCFSGFYFFILPMNDIELFEVIKPKQNLLHQRECVNFLQTSVFVDVAFESHIAIFHHEIKQRILDELFFFFFWIRSCVRMENWWVKFVLSNEIFYRYAITLDDVGMGPVPLDGWGYLSFTVDGPQRSWLGHNVNEFDSNLFTCSKSFCFKETWNEFITLKFRVKNGTNLWPNIHNTLWP